MIQRHFYILFFIVNCFLSISVYSQREIPLEEEKEEVIDENLEEDITEQKIEVYSVFNDFRIPTRENINASDLRYNGWVTDQGMYTFRCRNGERIRLTLWYLDRGKKEVLDSEFINITPAIDDCQRDDIEYKKQSYRQSK